MNRNRNRNISSSEGGEELALWSKVVGDLRSFEELLGIFESLSEKIEQQQSQLQESILDIKDD